MSKFEVLVTTVRDVETHPNADRLDLAVIGDYRSVVGRGEYQPGDVTVYIPEKAVLPTDLVARLGLEGKLSGKDKNRVKAVRLRGELSQGLLYRPDPWPAHWTVGSDVAEELGIIEHTQPVPVNMSGKMVKCPSDFIRSYDMENIKKYPDVLQLGERIILSEKLHGSLVQVGCDGEDFWVSSKGISQRGWCLLEEETNTYWRIARQLDLFAHLRNIRDLLEERSVILYGEVLGVQDLMYGLRPGQLDYRAFDIYTAKKGFLDYDQFLPLCAQIGLPTVPVLYDGPYSLGAVKAHTDGVSTIAEHIREGVVIRAEPRRFDPTVGRVILKSVSSHYLLRKGDTTEFE